MKTVRVSLFASLFAFTMFGADITGIWTGQAPGRNGETQDVTFNFKQSGSALTGKMYGDTEDTPIADGKISGDQISFSVATAFGGGQAKFLFSGTIQGNEMQLTREREGRIGDSKSADKKQNLKQTFSVKRVT